MSVRKNNTLLLLIRKGLGGDGQLEYDSVKWEEVMTVASAHGLSAIAFDGLEKALDSNPEWPNEIPKPLLMKWYGLCVQQTALFKKNWSAACTLASLLGENGIEVWFTRQPNPFVWLGIIVSSNPSIRCLPHTIMTLR